MVYSWEDLGTFPMVTCLLAIARIPRAKSASPSTTFPRSSALIVKIWSLSYSDVGCEIFTELKLKWTKNYAKWSEVKDYALFQSYQVILQLLGSQRTQGKLMIQTENRPPMVVRWDKMVRVRTWLMWRHWGKWSAPFITPIKDQRC